MKLKILCFLIIFFLINLSIAQIGINSDLKFRFEDEETFVRLYAKIIDQKISIPFESKINTSRRFGFIFNETKIFQNFTKRGISFDRNIFIEIDSNKTYTKNKNNRFVLERNLTGQFKNVTNQIGIKEERQLKRFLTFEDIFKKKDNLFNITRKEVNVTVCEDIDCKIEINKTINITIRKAKDIGISFLKEGRKLILKFFNIFDLDPTFTDDTDSDWNAGTFRNMETSGVGLQSNLTSNSTFGHFGSQVFDAGSEANWSNITVVTEVPYEIEIGRALGDGNSASDEDIFINTSGLIVLYHFNNESGEDRTLIKDFSVDVNNERIVHNNATCDLGANECGFYSFDDKKFGQATIEFDGINDFYDIPNLRPFTYGNFTFIFWFKSNDTIMLDDINLYEHSGSRLTLTVTDDSTPDGRLRFILNATSNTFFSTVTVIDEEWHHIVFMRSNDRVLFYIDGVLDSNQTDGQPGTFTIDATPHLTDNSFDNNQLSKSIDEFSFWNRSLNSVEVSNLYKRGTYIFNLSARVCDDSSCIGETYTNIQPNNITSGFKIPLNLTTTGRFFQYNITYSNESSFNSNLNVNNLTIEFELIGVPDNPPNVSLISPLNNTITQDTSIQFICNASDDFLIVNVTLYHNLSGSFQANQTNIINNTITQTFFNITIQPNATIIWNCEATDNVSQSSFAENNFTLTINQSFVPPPISNITIILISPSNNSNASSPITFIYNVTSIESITNCTITFNNSLSFTNSNITTNSTNSFLINFNETNTLSWNVTCEDNNLFQATSINLIVNVLEEIEISLFNCPLTQGELIIFALFLLIAFTLLYFAEVFKINILGILSSIIILFQAFITSDCNTILYIILALFSFIVFIYFTTRSVKMFREVT